jgi:hypothetical protein
LPLLKLLVSLSATPVPNALSCWDWDLLRDLLEDLGLEISEIRVLHCQFVILDIIGLGLLSVFLNELLGLIYPLVWLGLR